MSVDTNGLRAVEGGEAAENRGQIKSRDRVRDLAEVYTHKREVDAMLDLVPDMFPSVAHPLRLDRKFFEPACGSGNFLEEILHRKLLYLPALVHDSEEQFEYRTLQALASIYAIDINQDNVDESRNRLGEVIVKALAVAGLTQSEGFSSAMAVVIRTNIQCADTIKDANNIRLVDYVAVGHGHFVREWSCLDPNHDDGLFALLEASRDREPIHYSRLRDYPRAVTQRTPAQH